VKIFHFLLRDVMLERYMLSSCVYRSVCLSVSLSVCLSVTGQSSTKMTKPRITQVMPYDSPGALVFWL